MGVNGLASDNLHSTFSDISLSSHLKDMKKTTLTAEKLRQWKILFRCIYAYAYKHI